MKFFRFVVISHTILTLAHSASGATLVCSVDARRMSGTAVGIFPNNSLPSFLLVLFRHTNIDVSGINYSPDPFQPSNPGCLYARTGGAFYAFDVSKWSNNGTFAPADDRLRFYGAAPARSSTSSSGPGSTVVPEPSTPLLIAFAAATTAFRRRRG